MDRLWFEVPCTLGVELNCLWSWLHSRVVNLLYWSLPVLGGSLRLLANRDPIMQVVSQDSWVWGDGIIYVMETILCATCDHCLCCCNQIL